MVLSWPGEKCVYCESVFSCCFCFVRNDRNIENMRHCYYSLGENGLFTWHWIHNAKKSLNCSWLERFKKKRGSWWFHNTLIYSYTNALPILHGNSQFFHRFLFVLSPFLYFLFLFRFIIHEFTPRVPELNANVLQLFISWCVWQWRVYSYFESVYF